MFAVFDLDRTLANTDHREHLIAKKPAPTELWEKFFDAQIHDTPIWPVVHVARALMEGYHLVEIWTGRPARYRSMTLDWITRHSLFVREVPLVMRADDDRTNDDRLKERWMMERGTPHLVFEDRKRIVDMFRSHGVKVCQVDEGNF